MKLLLHDLNEPVDSSRAAGANEFERRGATSASIPSRLLFVMPQLALRVGLRVDMTARLWVGCGATLTESAAWLLRGGSPGRVRAGRVTRKRPFLNFDNVLFF